MTNPKTWHTNCLLNFHNCNSSFQWTNAGQKKAIRHKIKMKISKTILAVLATGLISGGLLSQQAQAAQITGDISFGGTAIFDTHSLATATQVNSFQALTGELNSARVGSGPGDATGDFSGLNSQLASFPPHYVFSPSSTQDPLWSIGGFTFHLTSSTVVLQTQNFLNILGTGFITSSNPGFDRTGGTWSFASSNSSGRNHASFTFQANSGAVPTVPDSGSTVALLGAGLIGLAALRAKLGRV